MRPDNAPMLLSNRPRRFTLLNLILIATSVALVSAALVVPSLALGQGNLPEYGIPQVGANAGLPIGQPTPTHIIAIVVNTLLGVLGVVAVVVVLYGGFVWMTAGGNEEHVRKAKELLGGAVVGLALVLASYVIASFVIRNVSSSAGYIPGSIPTEDLLQPITCLAPNTCVPLGSCTGQVTPDSCAGSYVCCRPTFTPPPVCTPDGSPCDPATTQCCAGSSCQPIIDPISNTTSYTCSY